MNTWEILYIRETDNLDQYIAQAVESLEDETTIKIQTPSFLDEDEFDSNSFKIYIFRDIQPDAILSKVRTRYPLRMASIIEILLQETASPYFVCEHNLWHETITEETVKNTRQLTEILNKNLKLLRHSSLDNFFLKELFLLIPDGVLLFDLQGKILESNSRFTKLPINELRKRTIYDFLDDETIDKVKKLMKISQNSNTVITMETTITSSDGRNVPVEVNTRLLRDDKGKPLYFLGILTDITVKKKDWEKGQFLSHLIDTSPNAIFALTQNGVINVWNRGAEELFGIEAKKAIGSKIRNLVSCDLFNLELEKLILQSRTRGRVKSSVIKFIDNQGKELKLEMDVAILRDHYGVISGISATLRDVTQEQMHMEKIRQKNDEMEHLINVVSHELRSPIHSVDNYASFIQESIREKIQDDSVYEMFERIQVNLSNMENLIRDLTDFSRASLDSGNMVALDVNSLIDEIATNIQWQVGKKNLEINTCKLPIIRTNPSKMYQVFENLLTNAYKFRRLGEPARVEISYRLTDDHVVFLLRDHGIGVSPAHQDKIFNLFYRAKEKEVDGTGAGLAITRKIIDNYGGSIWVESPAQGMGSVFCIAYPRLLAVKIFEIDNDSTPSPLPQ